MIGKRLGVGIGEPGLTAFTNDFTEATHGLGVVHPFIEVAFLFDASLFQSLIGFKINWNTSLTDKLPGQKCFNP